MDERLREELMGLRVDINDSRPIEIGMNSEDSLFTLCLGESLAILFHLVDSSVEFVTERLLGARLSLPGRVV